MWQDLPRRLTFLVGCALGGSLALAGTARAQGPIPVVPGTGPGAVAGTSPRTDALVSCAMGPVSIGSTVRGQTPLVPYYGKNDIQYDKFEWHIYTTDRFEIYYYPQLEQHLERIASYAESAYQHISSHLKHDLPARVPLVLFKTHSEFQQQHIAPGAGQEGVAAFAESHRGRLVLPLDWPPDQLYGLIVHELTHAFEYDIIPRSLVRRGHPLWIDEGLAEYLRGAWEPLDLMMIRDVAVADIVPKMTRVQGYGNYNPRLVAYNLGHAAFEFIESRWGQEGIRQLLFSLRKSVVGGGESAFEDALRVSDDEFDDQFTKYLKDRFKAFRDKEQPMDYGRDLSPDAERGSPYTGALSIEPSPSGELIAAVVGNMRDRELDLILLSAKDRQVVRNITRGFAKDSGYEYITYPTTHGQAVPWIAWSPTGDLVAYFARTEKHRSLILRNVVTGKVARRYYIATVDAPESPTFSPDGRTIVFAGLRDAVGDLFQIDLESGEVSALTSDAFGDYAPRFAPDGKSLVYLSRISGNDKLFTLDLETHERTQLTFGTHNEGGARYINSHTLVFPSTAVDPTRPVDPEIARNGQIYNIWTLDLSTGALRQYTDVLTGNLSPILLPSLKEDDAPRVAFVTYFKGEQGLHEITLDEPKLEAASSDFGAPGPVIDFQPPLAHTLVADNQKRKGRFEKLMLDGRPPVSVGITSGGDLFGGTQVSFSDVLGDQQFSFYVASISQYRTLAFGYHNLSRRLQWGAQAFQQTLFYYGLQPGLLFDPRFGGFLSRDDAIATQTTTGASVFAWHPIDRYRRLELSGGLFRYSEQFRDPALQEVADEFQEAQFGRRLQRRGTLAPFGVAFVQETTVFREFGPLSGSTMRVGYEVAPSLGGNSLSRQSIDGDVRYYKRLATTGVLALRFRGFRSWGDAPGYRYFGGNSELRGYEYLEFVGDTGFHANAELRFPLIEAMLTPLGVMGGVRGVFFGGIGGASFDGRPATTRFGPPLNETNPDAGFRLWTSDTEAVRPLEGFQFDETGFPQAVYGPERQISGFRLVDGRASYGVGLESFILGFPIHFDWSWRTLFNRDWEDALFAFEGGSSSFRKPRFAVWIGYDF